MTPVTREGAALIFKGRRLSVAPFRRERAATPAAPPPPPPPRRQRRGAGLRPLPLFALCLVIAVATLILTRTFAGPTYSAGRHSGPTVSADGPESGQDSGTGEDGGATGDPGTGTGGGQGDDPDNDRSTGEDPTTGGQPAGQVTGSDTAPVPVPQPQAPAAPRPAAPPPAASPPAAPQPPPSAPSTPPKTVPSTGPGPTASPIPAPVVSFEAEATTNTLSSTAKVVTCAACSGGRKVGHLGRDTGTLAFNNIHVTGTGRLDLTIAYLNGDRSARTATLSVNGAAPVELTFAPTGDWNTPGVVRVSVVVKDGANTLTPGGTGPAPDLDKISLG